MLPEIVLKLYKNGTSMQKLLSISVEYNACSPIPSPGSGETDGLRSSSREGGLTPKVCLLSEGGGQPMCKSEFSLGSSIATASCWTSSRGMFEARSFSTSFRGSFIIILLQSDVAVSLLR